MHEEMEHPSGLHATRRSPGTAPVEDPPGGISKWEKNYEDLVERMEDRDQRVKNMRAWTDLPRPRVWNNPE